MENYFTRFRDRMEAMEKSPETTEAQFLSRLHSNIGEAGASSHGHAFRKRRLFDCMAYGLAAAAAVFAAVIVIRWNADSEGKGAENGSDSYCEDLSMICAANFRDGLMPLYSDVLQMEAESEVCSEMRLSAVIAGLMESPSVYVGDIEGIGPEHKADMTREYCARQADMIRELYRQCAFAHVADMGW